MTEKIEVRGMSTFFYWAIPLLLGVAAVTSLGFATGIVNFKHAQKAYSKQQIIAQRMADRVGRELPAAKPIDLVIDNRSCMKVSNAWLDGLVLTVHVTNHCHVQQWPGVDYFEIHWAAISKDGILIHSGYENTSGAAYPHFGETTEYVFSKYEGIPEDDRIDKIKVWATEEN